MHDRWEQLTDEICEICGLPHSNEVDCSDAETAVFVGSWAAGDGSQFRCGNCGKEAGRGVNLTVRDQELNICGDCADWIAWKLRQAEKATDTFDDIRFAT